jgi:hypothetical protein
MQLLSDLWQIVRDQSVPEHRVTWKTMTACVLLLAWALSRVPLHSAAQWFSALFAASAGLFVAFFVSAVTGTFYAAFLRDVGAENRDPRTLTVFVAEWSIAVGLPLVSAAVMHVLLLGHEWN